MDANTIANLKCPDVADPRFLVSLLETNVGDPFFEYERFTVAIKRNDTGRVICRVEFTWVDKELSVKMMDKRDELMTGTSDFELIGPDPESDSRRI